jgi:hypothetical protein
MFMSEHEAIIRNLRKLMKDGATVAKCLRVIRTSLQLDDMGAIEFFRAAFRLGPGITQKALAGYARADVGNTQQGFATFLTLPIIVQNRNKWDEMNGQTPHDWFDSLSCSPAESIQSKALASIQDDKVWATVPAAVREQYLTVERSRLLLSEYGEIIARLAEQLQLRIDELEREKQERSTSP